MKLLVTVNLVIFILCAITGLFVLDREEEVKEYVPHSWCTVVGTILVRCSTNEGDMK